VSFLNQLLDDLARRIVSEPNTFAAE